MSAAEPRRRWPRSVRARAALAAAAAAAVVLAGIGWWVHRDVYHRSTEITDTQAQEQLWDLVDQLHEGAVPGRRSALPYEIVASGRRSAVAYGGAMESFDPGIRHVLPSPPVDGASGYWDIRTLRLPVRRPWDPGERSALPDGSYRVMTADVRADELGRDKAAALGVAPAAKLRVYVVLVPDPAEALARTTDGLLLRAGGAGLVLIAAVAYVATRLALRPVEAIRVRTASVTASDPRERVDVPGTGDEIAALATTINATLQRLDDAAVQQRRFVADAAHELRSPLTTLLASLEVALAYPERTDWPAAATTAARQTRRLQALAEDLLLLARLDARAPVVRPGTVDLAALAAAVAGQHAVTGGPPALSCDSRGPAPVHGDRDEFERLLRNLVDNAVRHAAHRVGITVRDQDGWIVLTVRDDGPGVPAKDAERVFERFVRLDDARSRDRGGAGLGLAIARDLATRHGGTLTLAPGSPGACFVLRVPKAG
ncbi:sensor histidine kinase [Streptomyces liangshanensis]|uniref:histidine kinase n=1 Tax=Streptomyces liangshanensis TaxID=2717324 RepID=A0A6G9H7S0_9ACTN|nr:HAMP domain-containing sensor histidine kinase [Streptomyces liangshanensis]QIQ06299.1 HAMP domain-containing histidine kinase [Streptomyces liangshanensis]